MQLSQTIIGIIGNVTAIFLFFSPLPMYWKIVKSRSTQEFSVLPYACTMLNCLLWLFYGLPWVHKGILVITINGFGSAIELVYVLVFIMFANGKKRRLQSIGMFAAVVVSFALVVVINMLATKHKDTRRTIVGVLCCIVGTSMYVAPLSIMWTVMKTKSTKFMPLPLSIFSVCNCVTWMVYAIIGKDIYIGIPNGLGAGFASAQLVLYAWYCRSSGTGDDLDPKIAAKTTDTDLELAHVRASEKHIENNNAVDRS